MYVALFPCNECAKVIIQSGIKEVVFMSDKYSETNSMKASRKMMNMAKVSFDILRNNNFHCFFFFFSFSSLRSIYDITNQIESRSQSIFLPSITAITRVKRKENFLVAKKKNNPNKKMCFQINVPSSCLFV
jgi:hypothetical protein